MKGRGRGRGKGAGVEVGAGGRESEREGAAENEGRVRRGGGGTGRGRGKEREGYLKNGEHQPAVADLVDAATFHCASQSLRDQDRPRPSPLKPVPQEPLSPVNDTPALAVGQGGVERSVDAEVAEARIERRLRFGHSGVGCSV